MIIATNELIISFKSSSVVPLNIDIDDNDEAVSRRETKKGWH